MIVVSAVAIVAVAIAVPAGIQRLQRGLPGVDADAIGTLDLDGRISSQAPLGDMPGGIASGADAVWVAMSGTDQVARLDPEGGTVTERIDVQDNPTGVAFGDGAVWVTNSDARSVSRIDPASNRAVEHIDVGNAPTAIAYGDGALWVANTLDGTIAKIDASSGEVRTFPVGAEPTGVALGARSVWVVDQASGNVVRMDPSTGERRNISVGAGPSGIAFDGTDIWVANSQAGTVMKISPASNEVTGTLETGGSPSQVAAAGGQVWIGDPGTNTVIRIDTDDGGSIAGRTDIGNTPRAIATDGDNIWVTTRASATSHRGGTLTVESSSGPGGIDPNAVWDSFAYAITSQTNDGLLGYARVNGTAGSALVPDLAKSLPSSTDGGRTYAFDLRDGIRYSDGSRVVASDVRASIERVFRIGTGPVDYLGALQGADDCGDEACDLSSGIEVDDAAGTVTFHLTRPDPGFLDALALPAMAIVPASTPTTLIRKEPFAAATGPYMIDSFVAGGPDPDKGNPGEVHLVRNPYFNEWSRIAQPTGFPEDIVIRFGLPLDSATSHVEEGQADVLLDTPDPAKWNEISTRFSSRIHPYTNIAFYYAFLNTQVEPFDHLAVRRAVNLAVDRTEMAALVGPNGLLGTGGPVACQVLPPNTPGYAPYCPYTHDGTTDGGPDMAKAERLVDASGTRGRRVTVWSSAVFAKAGRYLASVLADLGYETTTKVIEDGNEFFGYVSDSSNRVQVGMTGWQLDTPDAAGVFGPTLSCDGFVPHSAFDNHNLSGFCDAAIDRQIRAAARLSVADPPRSNALWTKIDRAVVDQAPWVTFTTPAGYILVSERVGNVQHNPVLGTLLGQMWVNE